MASPAKIKDDEASSEQMVLPHGGNDVYAIALHSFVMPSITTVWL
jgi:hypothetical protein